MWCGRRRLSKELDLDEGKQPSGEVTQMYLANDSIIMISSPTLGIDAGTGISYENRYGVRK